MFVNIAVFFLLASRDIQSIKIDALTSNDPWKRGLLLRVILLTIHEWEMPKVASANKMNAAYEAAGISVELRKQMSEALRLMNKAQEKAQRLLYNTRNAAIGHRDADALLQYETIVGLDTMKTMEIVASFYTAADMFVKTLPNLILQAGSPSSLLRQYAKNA